MATLVAYTTQQHVVYSGRGLEIGIEDQVPEGAFKIFEITIPDGQDEKRDKVAQQLDLLKGTLMINMAGYFGQTYFDISAFKADKQLMRLDISTYVCRSYLDAGFGFDDLFDLLNSLKLNESLYSKVELFLSNGFPKHLFWGQGTNGLSFVEAWQNNGNNSICKIKIELEDFPDELIPRCIEALRHDQSIESFEVIPKVKMLGSIADLAAIQKDNPRLLIEAPSKRTEERILDQIYAQNARNKSSEMKFVCKIQELIKLTKQPANVGILQAKKQECIDAYKSGLVGIGDEDGNRMQKEVLYDYFKIATPEKDLVLVMTAFGDIEYAVKSELLESIILYTAGKIDLSHDLICKILEFIDPVNWKIAALDIAVLRGAKQPQESSDSEAQQKISYQNIDEDGGVKESKDGSANSGMAEPSCGAASFATELLGTEHDAAVQL
jgi:hypothetical protein